MSDEAIKRKVCRFSLTIYIAHAYDWICKKRSYTYTLYNVQLCVMYRLQIWQQIQNLPMIIKLHLCDTKFQLNSLLKMELCLLKVRKWRCVYTKPFSQIQSHFGYLYIHLYTQLAIAKYLQQTYASSPHIFARSVNI